MRYFVIGDRSNTAALLRIAKVLEFRVVERIRSGITLPVVPVIQAIEFDEARMKTAF